MLKERLQLEADVENLNAGRTSKAVAEIEAKAVADAAEMEKDMRAWADKEVAVVAARAALKLKDVQEAALAAEAATASIVAMEAAMEAQLSAEVEKGVHLEAEVELLKTKLATYDAEAAQAAAETALGGRARELEAAWTAAQLKEKTLQTSLRKFESAGRESNARMLSLQQDLHAAQAAAAAVAVSTEELQAEVAMLHETVATQATALEDATAAAASDREAQLQLAQVEASLGAAQALAESRGDLLEQSFEALDMEQRESEILMLQLQRELKSAEVDAARATAKTVGLEERLDTAEEEVFTLTAQRNTAEEQVSSLTAQRDAAKEQVSSLMVQRVVHVTASNAQRTKVLSKVVSVGSRVWGITTAFQKGARNRGAWFRKRQQQQALGTPGPITIKFTGQAFTNTTIQSKEPNRRPKRSILAWCSALGAASLAVLLSIFEVSFEAE
jgi:DNA repair exonuclease SbcCD ATPase subunit